MWDPKVSRTFSNSANDVMPDGHFSTVSQMYLASRRSSAACAPCTTAHVILARQASTSLRTDLKGRVLGRLGFETSKKKCCGCFA